MRIGRLAATVAATGALLLSGALTAPAQAAPTATAPTTTATTTIEMAGRAATPAEAARLTAAAAGHGCQGDEVSNNSYVHVCFERDGDVLWVYDDEPDGERAVGHLVTPNAHYFCHNAAGAGVRWVGCSFSATPENTTIFYFGTTRNGATGADHHETSWQYEYSS